MFIVFFATYAILKININIMIWLPADTEEKVEQVGRKYMDRERWRLFGRGNPFADVPGRNGASETIDR